MPDTLFVDIENDGPHLLCVGYAFDEGDVVVTDGPDAILPALRDPAVTVITQSDHDLRHFLLYENIEVAGPWHDTKVMAWTHDENQPLDQESLLRRYVGPKAVKKKRIKQIANVLYFVYKKVPLAMYRLAEYDTWPEHVRKAFIEYNRNDVRTLRELYRNLARALVESERVDWWRQEQVPYSSVLLDMETRGMPVNLTDTAVLAEEVRAERDASALKLRRMYGGLPKKFNLNSPVQVRRYLFSKWFTIPDKLPMTQEVLPPADMFEIRKVGRLWIEGTWTLRGLALKPTDPPKRKDKEGDEGEPSTASPELLYKHPSNAWIRELCLVYRRSNKLLGTYLDKFPRIAVYPRVPVVDPARDARIYGRFNQTGTVTGRLSSSGPNLQNIPARREIGKRVRGLFQGRLVIGDYDALEMRLMAHFSRDPRLVKVFAEGGDPHSLTARALFDVDAAHDSAERDIAKTVNYAIGYGAGAKKLAQTLTLAGFATTFATAKEYQALVEGFYPGLYAWKNRVIWRAKEVGFVSTVGGHNRHLQASLGGKGSWTQVSYGERQAVNSIIQGSAADVLRRVMLALSREYWGDMHLIAQIHDELLWEYGHRPSQATLASLQAICERGHGFDFRVPLTFVPVYCSAWSDKGVGVDLSLLTEDDDETGD